ncbi:AraC family transcriptional regulator [Streptococcus orisasini]
MISADFLTLSQTEQDNKAAYLSDRDKILFSPLSFEEYSRIVSKEKNKVDYRDFYRKTSLDGRGLTITRSKMYETTDIYISIHPRYSYPILHNHEFVELIYVMSGSCINYINGQAISMKKGDLCFMAPSTVHALLSVNDNDVIFNILLWKESFSTSFHSILRRKDQVAAFFKQISLPNPSIPYMIFHTGEDELIFHQILKAYEEFQIRNPYYIEMIGFIVNEIFIEISRYYLSDLQMSSRQDSQLDPYVYPIVSFIRMNYQTITLKELASIFSYSETYLSKLIKKNAGQSFKAIVEDARIEKAKELILTTNDSLTKISQLAGYFDSSHMNRDFVKRLGLSPKKWLKYQKELIGEGKY